MITVALDPPDEQSRALWHNALSLMNELHGDWTLVGGLMVQLLAVRYGVPSTRLTVDIDILADSRRRPSSTERIGATLTELGFEVAKQTRLRDPETAFRFERAGTIVDLIAPEKTGRRKPLRPSAISRRSRCPAGRRRLREPKRCARTSSALNAAGFGAPTRRSRLTDLICRRASPPTSSTAPAPPTGYSQVRNYRPTNRKGPR